MMGSSASEDRTSPAGSTAGERPHWICKACRSDNGDGYGKPSYCDYCGEAFVDESDDFWDVADE